MSAPGGVPGALPPLTLEFPVSVRRYQLAVFGCMLSWFLLGLHAPVLHQFAHHGRAPGALMVAVLLVLTASAAAGLVALLRAPQRGA